jgi:hypothetical protein
MKPSEVPDELVITAFTGVYGRPPRGGSAPRPPAPDSAVCEFIRKQLAAVLTEVATSARIRRALHLDAEQDAAALTHLLRKTEDELHTERQRAEQAERERDEARAAADMCGASMVVGGAVGTVGPCLLRHGHDGPVHQGAGSVRWSEAVLGDAEDFTRQVEAGDHDKPLADWEREVMEKQYLRGRVEQTEAALQRVEHEIDQATLDQTCRTPGHGPHKPVMVAADRLRAALDQPEKTP